MTGGQIGGCLSFAALLAAGQILFKRAALDIPPLRATSDIPAAIAVPSLWAALVLYAAATCLWIYLLQSIPLSRAYMFAALGFVVVPAAGVALFGEKLTPAFLAGAVLIVAGLLITTRA